MGSKTTVRTVDVQLTEKEKSHCMLIKVQD
jgi:hypothetical protein